MEVIKNLSDKGVKLILNNNQLSVKREWTHEQLLKILKFYSVSDFSHKPEIIDYKIDKTESYLIETFVEGELLNTLTYNSLQSLILSLVELYKNIPLWVNLQQHCKDELFQKLQSLPPFSEEELGVIHSFFDNFLSLIPIDKEIPLTQVHGDLKWDNIILCKGDAILIDWEWNKIGHFLQDLQKFIETTLHYNPLQTDLFLNTFFAHKNIPREDFLRLDCFYFFLNQILQLSKKRLSLESFIVRNNEKFDRMLNAKLYDLTLHWKKIKIWSSSPLSPIFQDQNEISTEHVPDIISTALTLNNQRQRISLNKYLMLKEKDFIILHAAVCELYNGKIIALSWKHGSGKSHILKMLIEKGVIKRILDEDLINIKTDWLLFWLADHNFKGYINGDYHYQRDEPNSFWSLDTLLVIDATSQETITPCTNLPIEHCIHEELAFDGEVVSYYNTFSFSPTINIYRIKNTYNNENFYSLLPQLWMLP